MENLVSELKQLAPTWAKDLKINLDNVVGKSSLDPQIVGGIILSTVLAGHRQDLAKQVSSHLNPETLATVQHAVATMAMTNVWYGYQDMVEDPGLKATAPNFRMMGYANHGGNQTHFEVYALSASIIGKCKTCVKAHVAHLSEKNELELIREVGRITAIINSLVVLASYPQEAS